MSRLACATAMVTLLWQVALATEEGDRALAERVVKLEIAGNDAALYELFAPAFKEVTTRDQLDRMIRISRESAGHITSVAYWRETYGALTRNDARIPITTEWYRVTTDKGPEFHALTITISHEAGQSYVLGYRVLPWILRATAGRENVAP